MIPVVRNGKLKRPTRRVFLRRLGGIAAIAATGGLAWRAWCQDALGLCLDEGAVVPDRRAGEAVTLDLIGSAILAANPHNTQPWRFRIGDGAIEMFRDTTRSLGQFDPWLREMHIGLGCALENLVVAAAARSLATGVRFGPEPSAPDLVARIGLGPATTLPTPDTTALAAVIPFRHTNRGPYHRDRPVNAATAAWLTAGADDPGTRLLLFDADTPPGVEFARQTVAATAALVADKTMIAASDAWFRHERSDILRLRDGVTVANAGLPPALEALARILPRPTAGLAHGAWLSATRDIHCATTPMFGLITIHAGGPRELLQAGRLWQRVHLMATMRGLAMQPLNQTMELADHERALGLDGRMSRVLADLAGDRGLTPVFGFRLGYAQRPARPSPRRPVRAVLMA